MGKLTKSDSRLSRRDEILLQAARVMRRRGALSTPMQDIAAEIGIAYTAFYHYFDNRDHLLEQLFLRSLEYRHKNLETCQGETGLDRLIDFIRADLTRDRTAKVRFAAVASLSPDFRKNVLKGAETLTSGIESLIHEGLADQSIRQDCHAGVLARMIVGLLNRFVSLEFLTPSYRRRMRFVVNQIVDHLQRGILLDHARPLEPSYTLEDSQQLVGPRSGIDEEMDRLQQILRTATIHFNTFGSNTSIPDLAADLGVTKTVIYQYAPDKQDLLHQCYMRGVQVVETSHRIASDQGQNPLDELLIHRSNIYRFHASPVGPFTLINAVEFLNPQQQRRVRMRNRTVAKISQQRLIEGISQGQFRPDLDPEICQELFGQAFYNLPGWSLRELGIDIDDLVQETGRVLMRGIASE